MGEFNAPETGCICADREARLEMESRLDSLNALVCDLLRANQQLRSALSGARDEPGGLSTIGSGPAGLKSPESRTRFPEKMKCDAAEIVE
jgi:hypothetical protein